MRLLDQVTACIYLDAHLILHLVMDFFGP